MLLRRFVQLYEKRSIIWAMALREMQARYSGTLVGLVWSIVHPLVLILIYWFVFSAGLRVKPAGNIPFVVLFLCGFIPWATFAETLSASTNAITASPHLVKKMAFPTHILPVVHLLASTASHAVMLVILVIVLLAYGLPISPYALQVPLYWLGMALLCVGLGWIVASLNVFYRDVGQILTVVLNMWFWLTPIVWPIDMLSGRPRAVIQLNPMYYIVAGYRASFIYSEGFWTNWRLGVYFWAVALAVFAMGNLLFRRLEPDFAEGL